MFWSPARLAESIVADGDGRAVFRIKPDVSLVFSIVVASPSGPVVVDSSTTGEKMLARDVAKDNSWLDQTDDGVKLVFRVIKGGELTLEAGYLPV